jgi:DNA-directed RNA polymerase II subunit RPB1
MALYKELSYEYDIERIDGIQFRVMGPDEIVRRSVAEIVSTDTFAGTEPIIGGLFDPRLGLTSPNALCKTCEQGYSFCGGHFGHIVLGRPVFYIHFLEYIKKLLKCVCFKCSKILVDVSDPDLLKVIRRKHSMLKRFDCVYALSGKEKIKKCGNDNKAGCGAIQPDKVAKDNLGKIIMEWKNKDATEKVEGEDSNIKQTFFANDILRILEAIPKEDAELLGFTDANPPCNLICSVFGVPPPNVRPSVRNDTGQRCEDDLTHKLCDIVKWNNALKQKINSGNNDPRIIDFHTTMLQYHISTFIDNNIPGMAQAKQRSGKPLRSLTERLKSKEGRIRGNLMGKRVDYSARSVITPDPRISIDELGVPLKIAMNLTFPEIVNQYNIAELENLVRNGPDVYPGARNLRKTQEKGRIIRLKDIDMSKIKVEIGDIVDRHLRNGDYALFNRQPSLHRMSMMGHRIRVMEHDTFRLNALTTPSYNADSG